MVAVRRLSSGLNSLMNLKKARPSIAPSLPTVLSTPEDESEDKHEEAPKKEEAPKPSLSMKHLFYLLI